jgi:hypothetical protein
LQLLINIQKKGILQIIAKMCTFMKTIPQKFSIHRTLQKVQKLKNRLKPFNYRYLILRARFPLSKHKAALSVKRLSKPWVVIVIPKVAAV